MSFIKEQRTPRGDDPGRVIERGLIAGIPEFNREPITLRSSPDKHDKLPLKPPW